MEEIAQYVILGVFFLVSSLVQRAKKKRAKEQQQEGTGEAGSPQPTTGWPGGPGGPAQHSPDYLTQLVGELNRIGRELRRYRAAVAENPLVHHEGLGEVASQLIARIRRDSDLALGNIKTALAVGGMQRLPALSRGIERARRETRVVQVSIELLGELTRQRVGRLTGSLGVMDRFIGSLLTHSDTNRFPHALLWEDRATVPPALVGPGAFGLAPISARAARSASGFGMLALGVGFDYVASQPGFLDEVRTASLIGELKGQARSYPYYARAQFDLASAISAWAPTLAADIVATLLLGGAYSTALIEQAVRGGLKPASAALISSSAGQYLATPPLLFRLAVITPTLLEGTVGGRANALDTVREYIDLPEFAAYALPNGVVRRLALGPLLTAADLVGDALLKHRFESLDARRLTERFNSAVSPREHGSVGRAEKAFLRGRLPSGSPAVLLAGAIAAESKLETVGETILPLLLQAVVAGPRRGPVVSPGAMSDRALLREAIILSEIL